MNKIRDPFIKKLLNVYYGVPVKSLKSRRLFAAEDYYSLFIETVFKNRVKEHLIFKQMTSPLAEEILLRENRRGIASLPEPLFHLQLINKEYLFLQRLPAPFSEKPVSSFIDDKLLALMRAMEELNRTSSRPLDYGVSFCKENPGPLEASFPLSEKSVAVTEKGAFFIDMSRFALHHCGYALWHWALVTRKDPDSFRMLLDLYYEDKKIPAREKASCSRLAREENFADLNLSEKGKTELLEKYEGI